MAMSNEELRMKNEELSSFGRSKGFLDSLRARGCRPFSTKIEPLALFPSVSNPGMTLYSTRWCSDCIPERERVRRQWAKLKCRINDK